jgi:predicted RND superfamily exporter protein
MKVNIEYKLPDEQEELYNSLNGTKFKLVIRDMDSILRSKLKHEELTEDEERIYNEIRDRLYLVMEDWDIQI